MAKQQASSQAVSPDVETIGQLMDAIRENRTPLVSIPIKAGSGSSLAQRIREGTADQPVSHPPELIDFNGLMHRCNKHYGKTLKDGGLLRAIGDVAKHKGVLIRDVRRMTFAEFNAALDEAMSKDEGGGPWSTADNPTRWAKQFKISPRTFKRHVKDGKIRAKMLSDRLYQVHLDDLPNQEKARESGHK
jgi:hypothetical protein